MQLLYICQYSSDHLISRTSFLWMLSLLLLLRVAEISTVSKNGHIKSSLKPALNLSKKLHYNFKAFSIIFLVCFYRMILELILFLWENYFCVLCIILQECGICAENYLIWSHILLFGSKEGNEVAGFFVFSQ